METQVKSVLQTLFKYELKQPKGCEVKNKIDNLLRN